MAAYASRALQPRTVHIKIYPTARTFAERTEVLRVLEKFGQVDYFRALRGEAVPNAFLAIFNQEEAAETIINSSPLRYRLLAESAPHVAHANPTVAYNEPPNEKGPELRALEAVKELDNVQKQESQRKPPEAKEFEICVHSSIYPHRKIIQRGPLYGSWVPVSTTRSAIASDLWDKLPNDKVLRGLRDWETGAIRGVNDDDSPHEKKMEFWGSPNRNKQNNESLIVRRLWPLYEESLQKRARQKASADSQAVKEERVPSEFNWSQGAEVEESRR